MKQRREKTRTKIISDILKVTREEKKAKKIKIMQRACPDQRYLDFLVEEGFMAKCNPDHECYLLTEKGELFLKGLEELV